jgi:hypothetical protein
MVSKGLVQVPAYPLKAEREYHFYWGASNDGIFGSEDEMEHRRLVYRGAIVARPVLPVLSVQTRPQSLERRTEPKLPTI